MIVGLGAAALSGTRLEQRRALRRGVCRRRTGVPQQRLYGTGATAHIARRGHAEGGFGEGGVAAQGVGKRTLEDLKADVEDEQVDVLLLSDAIRVLASCVVA